MNRGSDFSTCLLNVAFRRSLYTNCVDQNDITCIIEY